MFKYAVNNDVSLKLLESRHAEELFSLTDRNREYLREWLPWIDGTTKVESTRDFISSSRLSFAENRGLNLGIFYKDQIAGCIGLHEIDRGNRKTSIGYWLGAEYQGKGIMTSSCRVLIDYAFNDLLLNRVEIRAAVTNSRSRSIPERLGFVNEGIVRQAEWLYDHYVDHVIYGMLRDEWR